MSAHVFEPDSVSIFDAPVTIGDVIRIPIDLDLKKMPKPPDVGMLLRASHEGKHLQFVIFKTEALAAQPNLITIFATITAKGTDAEGMIFGCPYCGLPSPPSFKLEPNIEPRYLVCDHCIEVAVFNGDSLRRITMSEMMQLQLTSTWVDSLAPTISSLFQARMRKSTAAYKN